MTNFYWNGELIQSYYRRNKIAVEVAQAYCKKNGIIYRQIIVRNKTYETVYKRVAVARYMRGLGFSVKSIGYALNRDHAAIVRYFDIKRFQITEPETGHALPKSL
jgi:hypothetical protein